MRPAAGRSSSLPASSLPAERNTGLSASDPRPFEHEIARLIVDSLHLEIGPDEIDPEQPLFGDGLGLDSIDALELALALSRDYGLELRSDDPGNTRIFASLRSFASHVQAMRTKQPDGARDPDTHDLDTHDPGARDPEAG